MTVRARKLALTGAILSIAALFSVGRGNENEAQENQQTEGLIITADRTESKLLEDGNFYKRYAGNVHARTQSRDAEVSADVAEYDSRTGEVRFYGKSEFRDSTRFLSADTVVYRERDAELDASGHVRINEVGRTISADQVRYLRSQKTIALTGSVAIRDDSLAATITGERAVFNDLTGQALISGNPAMIRAAPGQGPLTVTGRDTLAMSRTDQVVRLWEGVAIIQDSIVANGARAVYDRKNEVFTLTGSPSVQQVSYDTFEEENVPLRALSVVGGDTIRVSLKGQDIRGVEIIGGAYSTTVWRDSTGAQYARSILESSGMRLAMADNRISLITAAGMAKSYYYQSPRPEANMFVNEAVGDTLRFFFEQGRVARLQISGSRGAGARGKYYEYVPAEADTVAVRE